MQPTASSTSAAVVGSLCANCKTRPADTSISYEETLFAETRGSSGLLAGAISTRHAHSPATALPRSALGAPLPIAAVSPYAPMGVASPISASS